MFALGARSDRKNKGTERKRYSSRTRTTTQFQFCRFDKTISGWDELEEEVRALNVDMSPHAIDADHKTLLIGNANHYAMPVLPQEGGQDDFAVK